MSVPPPRRAEIACHVHVSLPGDQETGNRLQAALNAADRKLGVSLRYTGEATEFVLMTREPNESSARQYARALLAEAAIQAGISQEELDRVTITQVVRRWRNLTGKPRAVEAPAGRYRTIDLGDRGQLCAMHEGPLGEWVLYLEGEEGCACAGRDLFAVLSELFELPRLHQEAWVYVVIEDLAGHKTPLGLRYPCPCCDFLTLTQAPSGSYATCPVCRWEDDCIQFRDLDCTGGANRPSLREARAAYRRLSAKEPRSLQHARRPLPEEKP